MSECRQCKRYRDRLEKIAAATRHCVKDFNADRDTTAAYTELRKEGERTDRMLQRARKREGLPEPVVSGARARKERARAIALNMEAKSDE